MCVCYIMWIHPVLEKIRFSGFCVKRWPNYEGKNLGWGDLLWDSEGFLKSLLTLWYCEGFLSMTSHIKIFGCW